jgi:hypothetical protein
MNAEFSVVQAEALGFGLGLITSDFVIKLA